MLRPAPRPSILAAAVMVMVLGLVAPVATRAVAPAVGAGTAAAAGGEGQTDAGGPAGEHAETAGRTALPAGARAIVRSATEHLRSPLRPDAPAAVLVALALACLASTGRATVRAGRDRVRRRPCSPVRRRGPPAPVVA
jgi:hypothetical protein